MATNSPESREDRAARVAALTALVRGGRYPDPDPTRLATAILRWRGLKGRGNGLGRQRGPAPETLVHRRVYQREYQRRRRAEARAQALEQEAERV